MKKFVTNKFVIPAEAGIHSFVMIFWIPAAVYPCENRGAGMTSVEHFCFHMAF